MKKLFTILATIIFLNASAQINIVPMPAEMKMRKGTFVLNPNTVIVLEGSNLDRTAMLLNDHLKLQYGFTLKTTNKTSSNAIVLNFERMDHEIPGAYILDVNKKRVYIAGDNEAGVFYGIQTLMQLLPSQKNVIHKGSVPQLSIPQVEISDRPRFAYRGVHFDVTRHFYPVAYVKKYIDYLAAYKFNTFHWHLTDDQGWRIEIKKYPKLTEIGGYRNGTIIGRYPGKGNDSIYYGGFYTQEEVKEVVRYAADRYITVIPEIEMPGHASAAIAAYPELSCFPNESTKPARNTAWAGSTNGKQVQQAWGVFEDVFCPSEYTFNFLQDVLDEVMPLFPSNYIHIGGDESPKENWKRSAFCQQLIKEKNLKDEHELQSYFIQRIEKHINRKGKKIIGWDEILEGGLAPNATVMSWRGEDGGIAAAKQGHDVIMTPGTYCYFDHSQSQHEDSVTIGSFLPLEKVYNYEPIPAALNAEQAKHILGAQANLWTEYIKNTRKVEYMLFPRLMALSEVLWTPKEKRDWASFERRLPLLFARLNERKVNYSKAYYDMETSILPSANNESILWMGKTKDPDNVIVFKDEFNTYQVLNPLRINVNDYLNRDVEFTAVQCKKIVRNGGLIADYKNPVSQHTQKFYINKATGKKISLTTEPHKSYPGNGAFTLVNGIQNEKGLNRSSEFLGFLGKDMEATIDLGAVISFHEVRLHTFTQTGSWIYPPAENGVTVLTSIDGVNFEKPKNEINTEAPVNGVYKVWFSYSHAPIQSRYIKVIAKNNGIIPSGNPGAGNPAWLFVDEIEVE